MNRTGRKKYPDDREKPLTLIFKVKGVGQRTYNFFSRDPDPVRVFEKLKERIEEMLQEV